MSAKALRGRPRFPKGEARDHRFSFLANAAEKAEIERLAALFEMSVSEWIRRRATTTGAERP